MRVEHFNRMTHGGAAIAAWRLHRALIEEGVDSWMLYDRRVGIDNQDLAGDDRVLPASWKEAPPLTRLLDYLRYRIDRTRFRFSMKSRHPGAEIYTSPRDRRSRRDSGSLPEIVHLHWISRLIDYPTFFGSLESNHPIVWTLHDMNAITGGCHFSDGCRRHEAGCGHCPVLHHPTEHDLSQRNYEIKRASIQRFNNLHVVAPSLWLAKLARSSMIFDSKTVHHIPYGVNLDDFRPLDLLKARRRLNLDPTKRYVCFGAADMRSRRKGGAFLSASLKRLPGDLGIEAIVFGSGDLGISDSHIPIHNVGQLSTSDQKRTVYSAADLFILPSLEDNLPLTGLESLACGTPIVAFGVGGIPDYVRPEVSGWTVPVTDSSLMAAKIVEGIQSTNRQMLRDSARNLIVREYSSQREAVAYQSIYQQAAETRLGSVTNSFHRRAA
ncbi:MAG: glycosyltransferase [Planctomycetota bacterium]